MKVKLLFSLVFCLAIFLLPKSVLAAEEFSTSYDVTYDVRDDGTTDVAQKIVLKNLTSQYYVSNFTLTIGSTTVSGVLASDESGVMEVKTEDISGKTAITVKFNQQIAGIDKKQTFTLKFKSKDFAQKVGRTWEVNLPRIPTAGNIESYNLVLSVPAAFGDPTSVTPRPASESQTYDRLFFHYAKNQLDSGISVNFGTFQVFDFNLKYNLENNALFPILTSVTLPPDTNYQDILISRISPEPENVTLDDDGNYLAWFKLIRGEKKEVTVTGSAKLYISPKSQSAFILTEKYRQELLKSDRFWEKDNPSIQAALREIFKNGTPAKTGDKAKLIYRYVVDTLQYDMKRLDKEGIERLGAVTALNNPKSAICMEFTDLFIAFSRAAGIPSRELDGFAYSQNPILRPLSLSQDLLHAWPEYFDEDRGWVMVDPTWENTSGGVDYFNKFDLNHLVLSIKGISSVSPYTSDDVKATISTADFTGKAQLEAEVEVPGQVWSGFPLTAKVKVVNHGNVISAPSVLDLKSQELKILGEREINLPAIPPFGSTTYQYNLRTPFLWQEANGVVEVEVGGEKFLRSVKIKPLFMYLPLPYLFGGLVVLVLAVYSITFLVHYSKKRNLVKKTA